MIAVCAGMLVAGFLSAFLPFMPVEAPLVAATVADGHGFSLGLLAGAGQSAGKLVIFLSTRGAVRSERVRRWSAAASARLPRPRAREEGSSGWLGWFREAGARLVALLDRPALTVPVILCSAVTGMPPLLAATVYAARTPMRTAAFGLVCLVGRSVRFVAIGLMVV